MMTKENVLFGIVGLLLGLIVGFMFANTVNQQGAVSSTATQMQAGGMPANAAMPPGHPAVPGAPGQGSIAEVQDAIEKARQSPDDFDAQLKAAELYYQIQRFDGAIEFLKRANALKPDDYSVVVHLANAHFDSDKYEEAESWYAKALAKKPDDHNVRTDLGLTFIFRDKPNIDRAIQEFQRVLQADPNHVQALQNLTVAYTKKPDAPNAKATLARLEQADPSNSAIAKLREDIDKISVQ